MRSVQSERQRLHATTESPLIPNLVLSDQRRLSQRIKHLNDVMAARQS